MRAQVLIATLIAGSACPRGQGSTPPGEAGAAEAWPPRRLISDAQGVGDTYRFETRGDGGFALVLVLHRRARVRLELTPQVLARRRGCVAGEALAGSFVGYSGPGDSSYLSDMHTIERVCLDRLVITSTALGGEVELAVTLELVREGTTRPRRELVLHHLRGRIEFPPVPP